MGSRCLFTRLCAMSSGVQVRPYLIFKISDDKKYIEMETTGECGKEFEDFCKELPDNDCRYAVFDTEITTKADATTNKMMFISWSDDNAPIKKKMLYASSKLALKNSLAGLVEDFQATCKGDLDLKELQAKAGGKV